MKLLKKIYKNKIVYSLRNYLNIKSIDLNTYFVKNNYSISDAFLWRTDNSFKTIFKFSDLLNLFFDKKNTSVQIQIFDKFLSRIKTIELNQLQISNEIIIDKKFLNGIEDYGIFYIYHKTDEVLESSLRNSCYSGFSYKNNLPSFVHGNCPTSYVKFNDNNNNINLIKKSLDIVGVSFRKNQKYKIQKYFDDYTKVEIFINNPTTKLIDVSVNNLKFTLEGGFSKLIDVSNFNEVSIISNCYFLRPIIINYKNDFIDVHHA